MHDRLSQHLHTDSVLVPEQHAFRKDISTAHAAFRLNDIVFKSLNQKNMMLEFFYDLAKAFGCVNLDLLLAKLYFYGIQGVPEDRNLK
jgi:hypothetical protein